MGERERFSVDFDETFALLFFFFSKESINTDDFRGVERSGRLFYLAMCDGSCWVRNTIDVSLYSPSLSRRCWAKKKKES